MCRVLKLEIIETLDELQELLRRQKTGLGKERTSPSTVFTKNGSSRNGTALGSSVR